MCQVGHTWVPSCWSSSQLPNPSSQTPASSQLPDPSSQTPALRPHGAGQAAGTGMVTFLYVPLPWALPVAAVSVKPGLAPRIFRNINSHPSRLCFALLLGTTCLLPKKAFAILGHVAQRHRNWGQGSAPGWGSAGALSCLLLPVPCWAQLCSAKDLPQQPWEFMTTTPIFVFTPINT